MKNKEEYTKPIFLISTFSKEDVIKVSGPTPCPSAHTCTEWDDSMSQDTDPYADCEMVT